MPRKKSKAVPEGKSPIPPYVMPDGIALEDFRRVMLEVWDRKLDKLTEDLRRTDQRLAGLEQDARQPRLAMEADGPSDTKTCGARRAPLNQYKRCMGIAFLPTGRSRPDMLDQFRRKSRTSRSPLQG